MLNSFVRRCLAAAFLLAVAVGASAAPPAEALRRAAPEVNPKALKAALSALACAESAGMAPARHLALIDYSLPSTRRRLWVFDLEKRKLLFRELVAHGRNSGDNLANRFSNDQDSLTSSLGPFRTLEAYDGRNGYSLRMAGLEPGVNDRAYERALVIHGAQYVNARLAGKQGRLGRSWGCPAVRPAVAQKLIDALKDGQFVFAWYPDPAWAGAQGYAQCPLTSGEPPAEPAASLAVNEPPLAP
ncbi:hypothetical protein D0B54_08185 [Solimonas sp. K1W22B-7]|uniref:murein L,D-transpeptidase catalytic domain family protein n=1 Tax=Solimonas sp. K1W22B-7 TaxID=2303331 RepID=UPI000E336558|nr:murein L,D-transpeptidase catalytic domain family protein [Solimonas sp. K1W22B-7]AXQ28660.1 hypothetical protein D0B54_08185 [Solimonas sp. K1W22B-7]